MTINRNASTVSFTFPCNEEVQDELIALLEDDGVSGFLQEDSELTVYCDEPAAERVGRLLETELSRYLEGPVVREVVAQRNWNEEWKKLSNPFQQVDSVFVLRGTTARHPKA